MLDVEPKEMLHPSSFNKLGLDVNAYNESEALIGLLVSHPEVMNRPIVVRGTRAVIARPSERVEELLD
jgi:arsenate reductase